MHRLPADLREEDLLTLIAGLNQDDRVHGILVQLPLPPQIDADAVLAAIDPDKDVDGFHVVNVGRLLRRHRGAMARARLGLPAADQERRAEASRPEGGGRRPLQHRRQADGAAAARENCTVTIAHSKTAICRRMCRAPISWSPPSASRR